MVRAVSLSPPELKTGGMKFAKTLTLTPAPLPLNECGNRLGAVPSLSRATAFRFAGTESSHSLDPVFSELSKATLFSLRLEQLQFLSPNRNRNPSLCFKGNTRGLRLRLGKMEELGLRDKITISTGFPEVRFWLQGTRV